MTTKLHFLGANGQVTGSRYLLDTGGARVLIDCGMFQERPYLGRNWQRCPAPPETLDCVLLTHAHLDHSGLLPKLVADGFDGPIYATSASRELVEIILTDAAHIQEEDARLKRKRHQRENRTGPYPVQPLYTDADVGRTMSRFRVVEYGAPLAINDGLLVTYHDAGHILGSAILELRVSDGGHDRTVVFSGDLGQRDKPIVRDPSLLDRADYVVMESTYGGRNHRNGGSVEDQLAELINATVEAGGNVVIPTFAVERAQELMYFIGRLLAADRIPHLMTFLDSPMAVHATEVFRRHRSEMDEEVQDVLERGEYPLQFRGLRLSRSTAESKAINRIRGTCIIMASSGMCTAGRIKHHLARNLPRPESTIVFVGYQAHDTLGRQIVDGARRVRIHGEPCEVRARVAQIHGLSAHADHDGLVEWITHMHPPPRRTFLTHGEPEAAGALRADLATRGFPAVEVPEYRSAWELE